MGIGKSKLAKPLKATGRPNLPGPRGIGKFRPAQPQGYSQVQTCPVSEVKASPDLPSPKGVENFFGPGPPQGYRHVQTRPAPRGIGKSKPARPKNTLESPGMSCSRGITSIALIGPTDLLVADIIFFPSDPVKVFNTAHFLF